MVIHGVGKTAIIEGLAYRIQQKNVPESLQKYTILETSAARLNNNCMFNGMLEKRVLELFNSLKDEKNVILFIDEIHTLIGAGANIEKGSQDIANMIKPYITNENIKIIGATTISEYNEYILPDKAFARRFNVIKVDEPNEDNLEEILYNTILNHSKNYSVKIAKDYARIVSKALVAATQKNRRNTMNIMYNPDLAVEIISNAFGYARLYDKKEISSDEFKRAYNNSNKVFGKLLLPDSKNALKPKLKGQIIKVDFAASKKN